MMDRRTVLAGVLACPLLSGSAAAQTPTNISIGFAPPLDVDLYSLTKTSVATGRAGVVSLSVTRRYRFARNGSGYFLTSAIENMTDDAPPELSRQLRANLAPLQGMHLGFFLADHGAMVALSDETQATLALQNATYATANGAPATPMLQSIAAMTPEQQRGLLYNEVRDLTRFAGQMVSGAAMDGDMAVIHEAGSTGSALLLSARVHAVSGISWLVERIADPTHKPRHGVIAVRMELLP